MSSTVKIQVSRLESTYSSFSLGRYLEVIKEKCGILLHSGKVNAHHQFHLVGYEPLLNYTGDGLFFVKNRCFIPLKNKGENWLNDFFKDNRLKAIGDYPFQGGVLGYFSYEYKSKLEEKRDF